MKIYTFNKIVDIYIIFFKKRFLLERAELQREETQRKKDILSSGSLPRRVTTARAGLVKSQESGIFFRVSHVGAGSQGLEPSSATLGVTLADS